MLPSTIRPAEPGSVLLPLATTEEEEEDSIASIVSVTQGDFRWEEPPGDQSEQQDEPPPHIRTGSSPLEVCRVCHMTPALIVMKLRAVVKRATKPL